MRLSGQKWPEPTWLPRATLRKLLSDKNRWIRIAAYDILLRRKHRDPSAFNPGSFTEGAR